MSVFSRVSECLLRVMEADRVVLGLHRVKGLDVLARILQSQGSEITLQTFHCTCPSTAQCTQHAKSSVLRWCTISHYRLSDLRVIVRDTMACSISSTLWWA
jgi:hypothetical protein